MESKRDNKELSEQLRQVQQELTALQVQNKAFAEQLRRVYTSHSWRLTAPLRKGKQVFDNPVLRIPMKVALYVIRRILRALLRYGQVQRGYDGFPIFG